MITKKSRRVLLCLILTVWAAFIGFIIFKLGKVHEQDKRTYGMRGVVTVTNGLVAFSHFPKYYDNMPMWTQCQSGTTNPMWGFILASTTDAVYIVTNRWGYKMVTSSNFMDQHYAPGTLPIYHESGRFWDPANRETFAPEPKKFVIAIWLDPSTRKFYPSKNIGAAKHTVSTAPEH